MNEKLWNRMLILSLALHLVMIGAFSIPFGKSVRKFDPFRQSYSVGLVGDIGGGTPGSSAVREAPGKPEKVAKPLPPETKKPVPPKPKPQVQPKENDVRSISPKRLPAKETSPTASKDEMKRLDDRIREMRRRAEQQEASGYGRESPGSGSALGGGSGEGGGKAIDPALYRYLVSVREKIENAWHIPFTASAKRNLEARVTIRIRRDGRITDVNVEKRSGNRVFDESVLRVLRSIDPLPPIPAAVKEEPLEVELLLKPEGVS